ncbi:MAG: tripartite tricarboxylate transporter substrate-binding protein, partial [Acidobacteriota bacterium]
MINMIHRVFIGMVFLLLAGGVGFAQNEYPDDTITIICNWQVGGGSDTVSRLIAKFASEKAGVAVIVKNVAGDGGAAGVRFASEAKADGYTVGIMGSSFVARNYSNPSAIELNDI